MINDTDTAQQTALRQVEITAKGKAARVPSAHILGHTVVATGKWIRMASLRDEEVADGEPLPGGDAFIAALKAAPLDADLFTFVQKVPDLAPRFGYHQEWDNVAIIGITSYDAWWKALSDSVQRAVKKARKAGVVVREVAFTDEFVQGIKSIYDETPVRQGKKFWHYHKDLAAVKAENATYPERSIFLGAFLGEEMIGFLKIIRVGDVAEIIQILSKLEHQDKRPTNALLAKAVEVCAERGVPYLGYCKFIYHDPNSSLTEFKRRNGFKQVLVPRYFVPLTLTGRVALALRLHRDLLSLIPTPLLQLLLKARTRWAELSTGGLQLSRARRP